MGQALIRLPRNILWELRAAWARGLRVSLQIDADETRVEGTVSRVSPTGAYAVVRDLHVPTDRILAVYRPSRLGDSTYDEREEWGGYVPAALRRFPGQMELPGIDSGE